MDDVTLVRGVLTKTADVVSAVPPSAWGQSTPCSEYDVRGLLGHMVGWAEAFAAAASGSVPSADPGSVVGGEDSASRFRAAASAIIDGFTSLGVDRTVQLGPGREIPASMLVTLASTEYLAHGCDLARGAGLPLPYSDDEAAAALARAEQTLKPEFRGEGKSFAEIVPVSPDAPAIDRFLGFVGRQPR
ncbi:MAG: TIGR03086 family protein [Frankiaceae bacterium]|nr:TIGR03086 family protein [Frankiaceae bacterium]MBV9369191.1 TIGR03086 family protein [Frankiales bacterium]